MYIFVFAVHGDSSFSLYSIFRDIIHTNNVTTLISLTAAALRLNNYCFLSVASRENRSPVGETVAEIKTINMTNKERNENKEKRKRKG